MRLRVLGLALLLAGCANADMPQLDMALKGGEEPAPQQAAETESKTKVARLARRRVLALSRQAPDVPEEACEGPAAAHCRFINTPVKLSRKAVRLPGEPYPFFHTRNTLKFVDARKRTWVAPAGILTDGASIPPIFVPFIGDPRSPEFLNAAVVHDSYSAESNRDTPYYHAAPWQDVHRMFYDALRVSGTPPVKAKIMYAAVYLGGPRWEEVRTPPQESGTDKKKTRRAELIDGLDARLHARLGDGVTVSAAAARGLRALQANVPLTTLYGRDQLLAAFQKAKAFIEAGNPPIRDVEIYLTQLEQDMAAAASMKRRNQNFKALPFDVPRDFYNDGDGGISDDSSGGRDQGSGASQGSSSSQSGSSNQDSGASQEDTQY